MSRNQIFWTGNRWWGYLIIKTAEVCLLGGCLSPLFVMSRSPVVAACESIVASRGCDRNSPTSGFLGSELNCSSQDEFRRILGLQQTGPPCRVDFNPLSLCCRTACVKVLLLLLHHRPPPSDQIIIKLLYSCKHREHERWGCNRLGVSPCRVPRCFLRTARCQYKRFPMTMLESTCVLAPCRLCPDLQPRLMSASLSRVRHLHEHTQSTTQWPHAQRTQWSTLPKTTTCFHCSLCSHGQQWWLMGVCRVLFSSEEGGCLCECNWREVRLPLLNWF